MFGLGKNLDQIADAVGGIHGNTQDATKAVQGASEKVGLTADKVGEFMDTVNEYKKPVGIAVGLTGAGLAGTKMYRNISEANKQKAREKLYKKRMQKEAAFFDDHTREKIKDVATKTGIGAATAMGIKGLSGLAGSAASGINTKRYWNKFIGKYPKYEGDDEAYEHFKVMMDTSPDMAKHPVMVNTFLKGSYEHDVVNPDMISTLSNIQKGFNNRQGPGFQEYYQSGDDLLSGPTMQQELESQRLDKELKAMTKNEKTREMMAQGISESVIRGAPEDEDITDGKGPEDFAEDFINDNKYVTNNPGILGAADDSGLLDDLMATGNISRKKYDEYKEKAEAAKDYADLRG